jgi:hypothetical protein
VAPVQSSPAAAGNVARPLQLMTALDVAEMWVGLKNSDDVGTRFDLRADVFKNGGPDPIGTGMLGNVAGGSSGFNNARLDVIPLALSEHVFLGSQDSLSVVVSARIAAASGHRSGTARLWYDNPLTGAASAYSRFSATVDGQHRDYYLLPGSVLGTAPGVGPRLTADVLVDRAVGGNPFKPFGGATANWMLTLP